MTIWPWLWSLTYIWTSATTSCKIKIHICHPQGRIPNYDLFLLFSRYNNNSACDLDLWPFTLNKNCHNNNKAQWRILWICAILFLAHLSRRLKWAILIAHRPSSSVVVCKFFTFSTSSQEPLDGFWWNLVGMKYSSSLTSVVVFRPDLPRGGSRAGPK